MAWAELPMMVSLVVIPDSGPAGGWGGEPGGFGQRQQAVHPLNRATGGALVEVVEHAHHGYGLAVAGHGEARVVASRDFLHARRGGADADERRVLIEFLDLFEDLGSAGRL